MSKIQIFGVAPSSYVRTVRMACVEKGIEHALEPVEFGSDEHQQRHPFGKVPTLKHGAVELYETLAIVQYIDAAFDGPSLTPTDPASLGVALQWASVLTCYAYDDIVLGYLLPMIRNQIDDAEIAAVTPKLERDLGLLESALRGRPFIAGDTISVADLLWGPVVCALPKLPHTAKIIEGGPNVRGWLTRLSERPSAKFLFPPQG